MSNNPYEPLSVSKLSKGAKAEETPVEEPVVAQEPEVEEAPEEDENLEEISNGTIKEVLEYVGDDKDRAEQMMTLEIGKGPKSRPTLINSLHEVLS